MAHRPASSKPICYACNRPFNPASPGATSTLGPTCAKRFTLGTQGNLDPQLGFLSGLGEQPRPAAPKPTRVRPSAKRKLPAHLNELYILAKYAFDELFREFCKTGVLMTGERASAAELELAKRPIDTHSLADATLEWLEPEHDLTLILDLENQTAYHKRVFNGVVTLLETDPSGSPSAQSHIDTITRFTSAIRRFREKEDGLQLSLDLES